MVRGQNWWFVYTAVLSIRLHPKNDTGNKLADIGEACKYAATAADTAMRQKIQIDQMETLQCQQSGQE